MKLSLLSSRRFYKGKRGNIVKCLDKEECDTNHLCPPNPIPIFPPKVPRQQEFTVQVPSAYESLPKLLSGKSWRVWVHCKGTIWAVKRGWCTRQTSQLWFRFHRLPPLALYQKQGLPLIGPCSQDCYVKSVDLTFSTASLLLRVTN